MADSNPDVEAWTWPDPCPGCGSDEAFVLVETVWTPIYPTSDGYYEPDDRLESEYQHVECRGCGIELPAVRVP